MQFKDITTDTQTLYRLNANERCVFFMLNRSGEITFELTGSGAEAHIFSFCIGKNDEKISLRILQNHLAPKTVSHTLIKSIAKDEATCTYDGTIFIDTNASQSDASQESRALLLSPSASVSLKPTLEILTHDVKCHHAATVSPLNDEALFFAQCRGLSHAQAKKLLVHGFLSDALIKMQALGIVEDTNVIINKINSYL